MYEVYAHKQAPLNMTESPQSNLSFSSNANLNEGILTKQNIGIGFAGLRLYGAGKQVVQTFVNTSGNKLLQKRVRRIGNAARIGVELKTLGVAGTAVVETINLATDIYATNRQDAIDTLNQEYEVQKRGVATDKFVGVGERID